MADKINLYTPDFAVHPGKSLKDELDFLRLTQVELAQRTGLSEKHISQIINGEDPITSDTAVKLEHTLGTPAEFWNNLQKNYELALARIASVKRASKEINEAKKFSCYSELVKLGYLKGAKDWESKTKNLLKFFGVDSLLYIQDTEAIAFRQARGKFNVQSLAAWLRCGELDAKDVQVKEFDKGLAREITNEARKLTLHPPRFGEKLKELCSSVGIALVYVPYFKNTKVNGATRWVGDKALIQLNTRGAYSDMFWFTFFHELGHILLHGTKEKFLDYDGKTKDDKEKEADNFASENLISNTQYKVLLENLSSKKLDIKEFAKTAGVSPAIVMGRLAHEGKIPWKYIAKRDRLSIQSE